MRRAGIFMVAILLIISCKKKDRLPSGIMTPTQMQSVLFDMMRADQFLNEYVFAKDSSAKLDSSCMNLYARVMTLHNISRDDFKKSFDYYNAHPSLLRDVLDSISKGANRSPLPIPKPVDALTNSPGIKRPIAPDSGKKPGKKQLHIE
jgi:hypothetical protein